MIVHREEYFDGVEEQILREARAAHQAAAKQAAYAARYEAVYTGQAPPTPGPAALVDGCCPVCGQVLTNPDVDCPTCWDAAWDAAHPPGT